LGRVGSPALTVAAAFDEALASLVAMRRREGTALQQVLLQRIDEVEALAAAVERVREVFA